MQIDPKRAVVIMPLEKGIEKIPILHVMVGLPYSGKTTLAKEILETHGYPIVSPDAIRLALHGMRFLESAEPFVWAIAKNMVAALFFAGHKNVIIDATNTTKKRRYEFKSPKWARQFIVMETPVEECIKRAGDCHDATILPVIDRMSAQFEQIEEDELDMQIANPQVNVASQIACT